MPGARDIYIHWAQEMFDQAGMVREMVKWDYELRNGEQLETVIDRALDDRDEPSPAGRSICRCRARCWPRRCPALPMTVRRAASPRPRRPAPTHGAIDDGGAHSGDGRRTR